MRQRKLYLCSYGALKWVDGGRFEVRNTARLTASNSEEEVLLLLKEAALESFPESEGWRNHVYKAAALTEDDFAAIQDFLDHRFDDVENAPAGFLM